MFDRNTLLTWTTMGLAAACAILAVLSPQWRTVLLAQTYYYYCEHDLAVVKSCEEPRRSCGGASDCSDGNACTDDACDTTTSNVTDCILTATHADSCGDTTRIEGAFDEQDFGGDDVRVPALGDLPIETVGGNAVCCVGPSLPCFVGPSGATTIVPDAETGCGDLALPGEASPGSIGFRQNTYVVAPDDPDPLPDRGTISHLDRCDAQPDGCSVDPASTSATATTDLVTGCSNQASAAGASCPDADGDQCTIPGCNGGGTCQQAYDEVTCREPACDACDPADGVCKPISDPPAECAGLPHFQCFETHRPPIDIAEVSLVDALGGSTVAVLQAKRLCAPADKNAEDPGVDFDGPHLTEYMIKQGTPRFARVRGIEATDQFGTLRFDVVRPDRMLVPTAKSVTAPPVSAPTGLDHFKCYRLKRARFRAKDITVETQFAPLVLDIKRPVRLCLPADKNGEGISRPERALVCYQTRSAASRPIFREPDPVFTSNQFGPDRFDVFGPRELCVPATVILP
jgi:hypothetical protein